MIKKRAFSLIESAITLGVIGLLGGGIWLAASAVMLNLQANDVARGVLIMAQRGRNLIPIDPSGDNTFTVITTNAIKMGIPPEDWVKNGTVKSPWGGVMIASRPASTLEFYIYGLNEERCRKLVSALTIPAQQGMIQSFWNDDKAQSFTALSMTYTTPMCVPPVASVNVIVSLVLRP